MSFRSTSILCVIAIAGVIAAVLVERTGANGGRRAPGVARPLLEDGLAAETLSRIRLERAETPPMVFVRREQTWWQETPFLYPMDPASLRRLASAASELRVIDIVEADGDDPELRRSLGLDPPHAVVAYEGPGGPVELRLGRRGVGGMGYLEIAGDPNLYVVNQDLHERAVDMDAKEWRDRTLLRGAGVESDRIEIGGVAATTVLVRDRKQWRLDGPVRTRVDPEALDRLLQAIGRARGAGFILDEPDDLSRFGLTEPAATLTVHATQLSEEDGAVVRTPVVHRLLAGSRIGLGTEDRFGVVEGRNVIVRLPEPVLRALFPPPAHLVAATATGTNPADVKSIVIERPAGALELRRELERWIAPGQNDRVVPAETVEGLLETLTGLRASEVALAPYPRELEVATITLHGFDARPLDTVRVAREPGEGDEPGRWALENGDSVLRIYPASLRLPLVPADYGLRGE